MCMCVRMCVHACVCMNVCECRCVSAMCKCGVCVHVCMCVCACAVCMCVYACMCVYMCVSVHVCARACVHCLPGARIHTTCCPRELRFWCRSPTARTDGQAHGVLASDRGHDRTGTGKAQGRARLPRGRAGRCAGRPRGGDVERGLHGVSEPCWDLG